MRQYLLEKKEDILFFISKKAPLLLKIYKEKILIKSPWNSDKWNGKYRTISKMI